MKGSQASILTGCCQACSGWGQTRQTQAPRWVISPHMGIDNWPLIPDNNSNLQAVTLNSTKLATGRTIFKRTSRSSWPSSLMYTYIHTALGNKKCLWASSQDEAHPNVKWLNWPRSERPTLISKQITNVLTKRISLHSRRAPGRTIVKLNAPFEEQLMSHWFNYVVHKRFYHNHRRRWYSYYSISSLNSSLSASDGSQDSNSGLTNLLSPCIIFI